MFDEATEVGDELEISRPDLDRWALRSHERAIAATDEGRLPDEIVAGHRSRVARATRSSRSTRARAATPRSRQLAKLPGLSRKDGSHTAGNSPGVNDGAGALVLASDEWAEANGKEVLAEIVAQAAVADDFAYLARTPANAALKALDKAGPAAGRHRPLGDQRGVRLGDAELDPHARHRRGQRQRQRRRGRARPPDRRLGRAHPRRARARAAPARRRPTAARRSAPAAARATPSSSSVTEKPHILPLRPGAGPCGAPRSRARPSSTSTGR